MKLATMVLAGCVLLVAGASWADSSEGPIDNTYYVFEWALSASNVSPYENTASATVGESTVYLWVSCTFLEYVSGAELTLEGTLDFVDFTPEPAVLNSGSGADLVLAVSGCPPVFLAGAITVNDPTGQGGELCMAQGGVTYDCAHGGPFSHATGFIGFSTDGTAPCMDMLCPVDMVLPESWGRTKGRYGP